MQLWAVAPAPPPSGHSGHAPWFFYLVVGLIILIALAQIARPDLAWRMNRWQYKNKQALEPSAAGLLAARLTGVAVVIVGIVMIVVVANH